MKIPVIYTMFLFIFSVKLCASVITIAPLQIYSEEEISLSGQKIAEKIASGNIYLSTGGFNGVGIANILEASSYCEKKGIEYLIYGSLNRNKHRDSVELRFYCHNSRTIEYLFFASDNIEKTERLVSDLKEKISTYLIEELALYEPENKPVEKPFLSVPLSAGYWVPIDGYWGDLSVSLFSVRSGVLLNPFEELAGTEHLSLNFHFGINLLYEMAINDDAFEAFHQHKLKILLPAELSLTLLSKHRLSLTISPLYQLEILNKTRNYQDNDIILSSGFGFSTGIAYHNNFNDRFSAGLSCNFDFIFYENPQVNIRPELSFLIHSGPLFTHKGNTEL